MIKCTKCETENENGAKFCKSCGLPLNKQSEQFEEVIKAPSIEQIESIKPMRLSMLAIFPVLGMIYHLIFISGIIMIETIAASFSTVIVILGIPLIITGLVRLIKKINDITYPNFVKHTFIGTVIMFFLVIAGHINTKLDELADDKSTKATLSEAATLDENPLKISKLDNHTDGQNSDYEARRLAQIESDRQTAESIQSNNIIGTSSNMTAKECKRSIGEWIWDGNKNVWMCVKEGAIHHTSSIAGIEYPLPLYSFNYSGLNGRIFEFQIILEIEEREGLISEIDRKESRIRKIIGAFLQPKAQQYVISQKDQEQLKNEIIITFNKELKSGKVLNVRFVDFKVK